MKKLRTMCLHKMMLEHSAASRIGTSHQLFSERLVAGEELVMEQKSCCVAETTSATEEKQAMEEVVEAEEQVYQDALVGATQATRKLVESCKQLTSQFRRSTAYK